MTVSPPTSSTKASPGRGVTAVLGPTNTGKTHLAIDRMIAQPSGMIGLPLRLLAREVYNRICEKVDADAVALITGEEKIKPDNARYFVCTVEAMPGDVSVDFLAVDEVQLAADLERGHVFTDRILNQRGEAETLLLGAHTIQPLIEQLLPGANIISRPRFSTLTYAGDKKITRLPRRSAVVAFSANEVYAIAELVRRHRGGAAVVMGALSPRTRNAQVELYQNGDVDFLVATDAIGMGLNLDVNHVAFASDRKFDGFQHRRLTPAEFGQIAGRAGRYTTDGTFGVTGRTEALESDLVERIEGHDYEPLEVLQWRNSDLDFASPDALRQSLDAAPRQSGLARAPHGVDRVALEAALSDSEVGASIRDAEDLARLWSVCAVPDYRKIAPANHAELIVDIYRHLTDDGTIPEDWFSSQVGFSDRIDGDIDTLSNRIAHIRTWTFVANRPDWLKDPLYWRETTRGVEDRLSDALHEKLTQRFVDRRTSVLMRRLQETEQLEAKVEESGEMHVEDHFVGRLEGLTFHPDSTTGDDKAKAIRTAAQRVLASTLAERAETLSAAPDTAFKLETTGAVTWIGAAVGRLERSDDMLVPRVILIADDQLAGAAREKAQARLQSWIDAQAKSLIGPLFDLRSADGLDGLARGIAFQLVEGLGILPRHEVADDLKALDQPLRAKLRSLGVRFGAYNVFLPALLKPGPRSLLAQLFALTSGTAAERLSDVLALSASGRTSVQVDKDVGEALYRSVGYRVCGSMAVRIDILERLADLIRPLIAWRDGEAPRPEGAEPGNAFKVTVDMTSLVGCAGEDFAAILKALGYRSETRKQAAVPEPAPQDAETEKTGAETPPGADATQEPQASLSKSMDTAPADSQRSDAESSTATPDDTVEASSEGAPLEPAIEMPSDTTESGDTSTPDEQAAKEPALVEVTIWRPRGPDRRGARKPQRDPADAGSGRGAARRKSKQRPSGKPPDGEDRRQKRPAAKGRTRPARQPDPDSPFAALAALKDQLESES